MLNNINSIIPYTFTTALTQKDMSSMNISLQEYTDEGWRSIYEVPMDGLSDEVTFDYTTTSTNNLRLHYSGRTLMYGYVIVKALNVVRKDKLASSSIETLCEVDGDFVMITVSSLMDRRKIMRLRVREIVLPMKLEFMMVD
jgi:hypothetical protein